MPKNLQRRGAVYYIRRVVPKDVQAILGRKEIWRSLQTKEREEAKRRCRIEDVKFDKLFQVARTKRTETRQIAPDLGVVEAQAWIDAQELNQREAAALDAELHDDEEENGSTYSEWLALTEKRDRERDAVYFAEERRNAVLPLLALFDQYAAQPGTRRETEQQFRSIINHLIGFLGHDNAHRVRRADIVKWRDHLRSETGPRGKPRSAKTINDSYLSAVRTVFAYAVDRLLISDNPAAGVKPLPKDKRAVLRERDFTKAEQGMILAATLAPPSPRMSAYKVAARRWVPWLCAYTGARVNEITQLRAEDLAQIDGVWTIHITPEAGTVKTGIARTVPLHEHLIEQGFLAFAKSRSGPLFYNPADRRKDDGRQPFKLVGNKLAEWIRGLGLAEGVAPNHGWRHTFKTISREVDMPEAAADYIQGHANNTQGRKYGRHNLPTVFRELAKIPRFET